MTSRKDIDEFLGLKRLAVVGVSRHPKEFTRLLFSELRQRGYDVVPVNPNVSEVDGLPCYAHLQDLPSPVEGALLLTKPAITEQVVAECARAGVGHIWMYRAVGSGAVSPAAVSFCKAKGIRVIAGECPFMFLPKTGLIHKLHGFVRQVCGTFPS